MHPFPHRYPVTASATSESHVSLTAPGIPVPIESAGPAEFGGPGNRWSPEHLLSAALADCFILSFRAVARAARFEWRELECRVEGTLDRVDRVTRFTAFAVHARLAVAAGSDRQKAEQLLHKADQTCLVTNSLLAGNHLTAEVVFSD